MTDPITQSMIQGAAGAGGGDKYINDIFNIDIYEGKTGVGVAITNGMDYTKPSLVVIKNRQRAAKSWWVFDNESNIKPNGGDGNIFWNNTNGTNIGYGAEYNITRNATGYVTPTTNDDTLGVSGDYYLSYSLKKAANFFDIVTYTGTGSLRTIAHNLGATPGMIWVKQYGNNGQNWRVYHKYMDPSGPSSSAQYVLKLNTSDQRSAEAASWNNTAPTATHFTVNTDNAVNGNGQKYVAYLFADHSDGSGTFGEGGDQDVIECGRYIGNGGASGPYTNLGFEPDWVIVKRVNNNNDEWVTVDQMQQMGGVRDNPTVWLQPSTTAANFTSAAKIQINSRGFTPTVSDGDINNNGSAYIYMAIRRAEKTVARPIESPTEVFCMDNSEELHNYGFPSFPIRTIRKTDMAVARQPALNHQWYSSDRKLSRKSTYWDDNNGATGTIYRFDILHGWQSNWSTTNYQTWAWARNPGSFDIEYHRGTGNYTVRFHNLGVVPEMMWVKRVDGVRDWAVYHKGLNNGVNPSYYYLQLNEPQAQATGSSHWLQTDPNASQITFGNSSQTNGSGDEYLTYLFASKEGVSKVGYYQGTGASHSINFGFQPRFVIIKCSSDGNTKWCMWDSVRGWDKCLNIAVSSAQTTFQAFNVTSTGITLLVGNGDSNGSGRNYIYYAHA